MRSAGLMLAGAVVAILVGFGLLWNNSVKFLPAAVAFSILGLVYALHRRAGILLALIFLVLLGDIRRISALLTGDVPNDPLVLVGALFVALITIPIFIKIRAGDRTSKLMLALIVVMLLEVVNPGQGGIGAGLGGLVVVLPPLLWFWVGRVYGSESMIRAVVFRVIIPAGVLASFVGMYQTFIGVPPWQQAWINQKIATHFNVINAGNGIRAFGFSTAASEYVSLLAMGCFFCLIGAIVRRRVLLLPLAILLPSLFLASTRSAIVRLLFAGALGFALKSNNTRLMIIRIPFFLLVVFGGVWLALSQQGGTLTPQRGASAAEYDVTHQVSGLAHPLDARYSSAGGHATEIFYGFLNAFKHPIGFGTGATNRGAAVFGVGESGSTEFDISDTFLNLGLPGGLIFLCLIGYAIQDGYQYTRFGPKDIAIPIFAMMVSQIGSWFYNGEYGNGPLFFIMVGCMVRIVDQARQNNAPATLPVRTSRDKSRLTVEGMASS